MFTALFATDLFCAGLFDPHSSIWQMRVIQIKLAKQFIPLNLSYSFLPLTKKYALCHFQRSICPFFRLIHRESEEND